LQFETGQETDDGDPYVCFRRREVRQIRKTRGRDAQSAEKLRRLRKELEDARQLVALVRQRELARKEMLGIERQIFLQRSEVKEMKRKLGVKDDDEDLINQKVRKEGILVASLRYRLTSSSRKRSQWKSQRCNGQWYHNYVFRKDLVHMLRKTYSCWRMCRQRKRMRFCVTSSRIWQNISSGMRDTLT
jgi:hypothetical protein